MRSEIQRWNVVANWLHTAAAMPTPILALSVSLLSSHSSIVVNRAIFKRSSLSNKTTEERHCSYPLRPLVCAEQTALRDVAALWVGGAAQGQGAGQVRAHNQRD